MGFSTWLETSEEPQFSVMASDGTVVFNLKGVRYVYQVSRPERYHIWQAMLIKNFPGAAWKVYHQVKAEGRQIEPPLNQKPLNQKPLHQKTLW
jgi:hypothetical protein